MEVKYGGAIAVLNPYGVDGDGPSLMGRESSGCEQSGRKETRGLLVDPSRAEKKISIDFPRRRRDYERNQGENCSM